MDDRSKTQRSLNMSRIKSKNTVPEKAVRKIITELGWRYRLHSARLPGKPDIVIHKNQTVIFTNGCFWHQHRDCKRQTKPKTNVRYWLPKLERNVEKQKSDIKKLKRLGWNVHIIWECETKNHEQLRKRFRKIL